MHQQLLLNSKMTEHGIVQTASLFQEMIKAQEKRDLDPTLLAIPTFSGEAKDRSQRSTAGGGGASDTRTTLRLYHSIKREHIDRVSGS